jgi:hypothetical protein
VTLRACAWLTLLACNHDLESTDLSMAAADLSSSADFSALPDLSYGGDPRCRGAPLHDVACMADPADECFDGFEVSCFCVGGIWRCCNESLWSCPPPPRPRGICCPPPLSVRTCGACSCTRSQFVCTADAGADL